jgi:hypothetical protein
MLFKVGALYRAAMAEDYVTYYRQLASASKAAAP